MLEGSWRETLTGEHFLLAEDGDIDKIIVYAIVYFTNPLLYMTPIKYQTRCEVKYICMFVSFPIHKRLSWSCGKLGL